MDQGITISQLVLTTAGFLIVMLLSIIAFFATKTYDEIKTMGKSIGLISIALTELDGRLSGQLAVAREKLDTHAEELRSVNSLKERMQKAEVDFANIRPKLAS